MLTTTLTKKIRTLERRIKFLELKPSRVPGSLWETMSPHKYPSLYRHEQERRQNILQKTGGILKKKFRQNPVQWQRKMREDRISK